MWHVWVLGLMGVSYLVLSTSASSKMYLEVRTKNLVMSVDISPIFWISVKQGIFRKKLNIFQWYIGQDKSGHMEATCEKVKKSFSKCCKCISIQRLILVRFLKSLQQSDSLIQQLGSNSERLGSKSNGKECILKVFWWSNSHIWTKIKSNGYYWFYTVISWSNSYFHSKKKIYK